MTIIDKIKTSIQRAMGQMEKFPVYYHDEPTLNVIADTMVFPCAMVQLLVDGTATLDGGQAKEIVSAAVFFIEPSEFDFNAEQNERIIDRCKQRAFKWLLSLPLDQYLDIESVERTQRVYQQFDAILTGFAVLVRLKELQGVTDCEDEEPQPTPKPEDPVKPDPPFVEEPTERI